MVPTVVLKLQRGTFGGHYCNLNALTRSIVSVATMLASNLDRPYCFCYTNKVFGNWTSEIDFNREGCDFLRCAWRHWCLPEVRKTRTEIGVSNEANRTQCDICSQLYP